MTRNFSLTESAADLPSVRECLKGIEALADISIHLAVRHHLECADDVVQRHIEFGQPVIRPVIVRAGRLTVDRLLEADEELGSVLIIADLVRTQRLEQPRLHIVIERLLVVDRQTEIARHLVRQQPYIGQPLNIRMAAQGIHAATGHANVAEQQLDHRHGANVLGPDRVLGPAKGKQARHRLVGRRRGGDKFANLQIFVLRCAADARHHFRRIAIDMLAQQIDDAAWILPGIVYFGETLFVEFVVPS